jgi:hypothetical protein
VARIKLIDSVHFDDVNANVKHESFLSIDGLDGNRTLLDSNVFYRHDGQQGLRYPEQYRVYYEPATEQYHLVDAQCWNGFNEVDEKLVSSHNTLSDAWEAMIA